MEIKEPYLADPAEVRLELDRLLASPHFRNSKRCQALLTYVVNAYLEGALDRVKERTIGFEVFQRDPGYDTNHDSVVRTTAAEIRKRLAQYYMEAGHEEELRLSLPAGSYVPEFHPYVPVSAPASPPVPLPVPVPPAVQALPPPVNPWRKYVAIFSLVVCAAAGLWAYQTREPALESFWKPLLDDPADAVVCIEQPLRIFRIESPRFDELTEKLVGTPTKPPAGKDILETTPLKLSDLRPAGSQYFTSGDLMVSVRLSELLARHKKPFQVLGDRIASYHDLRGKPAILIGQFNNRWTLGLTGGLRFYLERDAVRRVYQVLDRQNPGKVIGTAPVSANRPEEYAIVSRVFNPATEKMVVTIMGMTQQGTIAGGDFLTGAAYMQDAFQKAPPKWYRKNLQIVLRTPMISGTPGPPTVVASNFW